MMSRIRLRMAAYGSRFGMRLFKIYYGERAVRHRMFDVSLSRDIRIREASAAEMKKILSGLEGFERRNFQHSIDIGSICFVAKSGGESIGYLWINFDCIDIFWLTIAELPDGGAYLHNAYVFPKFRGKRILHEMGWAVNEYLAKKGCRFCCHVILRHNTSSLNSMRKYQGIRYIKYQRARILKLPGLRPLFLGRKLVVGRLEGDDQGHRP